MQTIIMNYVKSDYNSEFILLVLSHLMTQLQFITRILMVEQVTQNTKMTVKLPKSARRNGLTETYMPNLDSSCQKACQ